MYLLLLACLLSSAIGQQTGSRSQVESEDSGNSLSSNQPSQPSQRNQPNFYNYAQTYQPAAQQRRPTYRQPEVYAGTYEPYGFDYVAQGEDGSSSRQETGDASGRVVGRYTVDVADGRRRVVDYVADHNGFRATIDTNEPGTEVQHPADVHFNSAAALPTANQQTTYRQTPYTPYRPYNVYRQRPTSYYGNVAEPLYHRGDYSHGYSHDHGHRHRGQAYTTYYNNDQRYDWH